MGVVLVVLAGLAHASPVHKPPQIVKKLDKQILLKFGPLNRFVLVRFPVIPCPHTFLIVKLTECQ